MENSTAVAYVNHTVDPISASLRNILSFLADCFDDGLQYRSLNVLRSALSSSYPRIDGYEVGQHSYVLNLMKSILNNRPPKTALFVYMGRPPGNKTYKTDEQFFVEITFSQTLLGTLLALTCPKCVSSLAKLDINHHRLHQIFTLTTPTKTSRLDETVAAFFSSFANDIALCPVNCLKSYMFLKKRFRRPSANGPNISLSRILNLIMQ